VGGTQQLSDDSVVDEVAEEPMPQDDATTAEVETRESEAETDSAIHRYLKTVHESIQIEMKKHGRPKCYIRAEWLASQSKYEVGRAAS
jgi:hypothetical protein